MHLYLVPSIVWAFLFVLVIKKRRKVLTCPFPSGSTPLCGAGGNETWFRFTKTLFQEKDGNVNKWLPSSAIPGWEIEANSLNLSVILSLTHRSLLPVPTLFTWMLKTGTDLKKIISKPFFSLTWSSAMRCFLGFIFSRGSYYVPCNLLGLGV